VGEPVLARLDERLADAGFPAVRYSDDFAALAASRDEAWEAMRVAGDAVGELGMRLGASPTSGTPGVAAPALG